MSSCLCGPFRYVLCVESPVDNPLCIVFKSIDGLQRHVECLPDASYTVGGLPAAGADDLVQAVEDAINLGYQALGGADSISITTSPTGELVIDSTAVTDINFTICWGDKEAMNPGLLGFTRGGEVTIPIGNTTTAQIPPPSEWAPNRKHYYTVQLPIAVEFGARNQCPGGLEFRVRHSACPEPRKKIVDYKNGMHLALITDWAAEQDCYTDGLDFLETGETHKTLESTLWRARACYGVCTVYCVNDCDGSVDGPWRINKVEPLDDLRAMCQLRGLLEEGRYRGGFPVRLEFVSTSF